MIVVVGSPVGRSIAGSRVGVSGTSAAVATAAAATGASVQMVGKVGGDAVGDAILLALAGRGVGHAALLRDPARATPLVGPEDEVAPSDIVTEEPPTVAPASPQPHPAGLPLDPADVELALRYLPDYRVVVIAEPMSHDVVGRIADAAEWAGAALVAVVGETSIDRDDGLPESAIILAPPPGHDPDGAFAGLVGALAAAIDAGASPKEAFNGIERRLGIVPATD